MKKYSNILVALGVTLFLLTVGMKSEAEAQPCTNVKDTLTIAGFPLCSIEGYDLEIPISYIGEESDCFILHTPCNP